MSAQQMVSGTTGIGQLLNERRYFAVPPHQRDFAWPLGAVEQFLEDVVTAMQEGDADYFLGLIVLVGTDEPAEKRYEILDGQQRLATTTMIYAAIRHWLRERGQDEQAAKIQNLFIGISEVGEEQDEPRLILNTHNKDLFEVCVVNVCTDPELRRLQTESGRHTSNRKLLDAVIRCREFVSHLAEEQGDAVSDQSQVLYDLVKFLRDHVQVNCLDVTSPENAYTIFEALNDRGIDLSVLDLLKNHLLRESAATGPQILHNWTEMVTRLGDRRADDFLKAFWTSRYGRIQRGRLFRELKRKYRTRSQVHALSRDLSRVAESYSHLEVADSDLWKGYSEGLRGHVRALSILGGRQTHPVILAALERFKDIQMETLLRYLVTLILRYQVVGRGRTGRLEILAARVAARIYDRVLKTPSAVWKELREIIPSNEEFREDFERYEETKAGRARWILRELEAERWRQLNPADGIQVAPLADPNKVNLEHILPRNPGSQWQIVVKEDPGVVADCRNRLGNLCLLDRPSNKRQASRPYNDKVASYERSKFLLTNEIPRKWPKWNREAIEARQRGLADLAVLTWAV